MRNNHHLGLLVRTSHPLPFIQQQIQAEQAKQREYEAAKASQRATAEAMQRKIQDMEEREKQLIMELRRTQVAQVQAYAELEEKLTD